MTAKKRNPSLELPPIVLKTVQDYLGAGMKKLNAAQVRELNMLCWDFGASITGVLVAMEPKPTE